jgi:hypothetical protein
LTPVILSCFDPFEKPFEKPFFTGWTVSAKDGKIDY